nr:SOS response-associated peptidase family protein [Sinorhizobium mexicanum]
MMCGRAGIWETWRNPETDEDIRTFCVVTCTPNEMMAAIHDRMPVILYREDYERWLSIEPDPFDLMKPFPAELMMMWRIGRKVGSPKNDTADILDPIEPAF